MRNSLKAIVATAVLAVAPFGLAYAATSLNVTARNAAGGYVRDVTVAAINFGMNGPSTHTSVGKTDSSGNVTLTLDDGMGYELFFSSHGYSPSLRDQFNNPDPTVRRHYEASGSVLSSTVTLTSGLAEVGKISLDFTNATPGKMLFGGVNNNSIQEPVAFGVATVDGFGVGTLSVDNVPYSEANVYNINLYDPTLNRGVGKSVDMVLNSGNPAISYSGADFNQSMPPTRVENTASQNSDGGSKLSVEGVVRSTETANWAPIPHNGINFQSCSGGAWTQVDENGRFQLFNLVPGATYYAEAFGGCIWTQGGGQGDCFEPWRSPALLTNQNLCSNAPAPAGNDFLYVSSTSLQFQQIKLNRVPKSVGQIKVYVKSASGLPIPNANVNIRPDGSAWNKTGCATHNPGDDVPNPGFSNANSQVSATGYALLDGLPSGNYELSVWTPFSSREGDNSIGAGEDRIFSYDWNTGHCGTDDYRITVDTMATPNLQVFNSAGVNQNLSSMTVIVNTGSNASGLVRGTLTFPSVVDLSVNPVMITINPNCDGGVSCGQGNFAAIGGIGQSSYTYSIPVSSGFSYWMDVRVKNWARVRKDGGGGDESAVKLTSTGTLVIDMSFVPAGSITGTVYKPDGTVFTPGNDKCVQVMANGNNGCAHVELGKYGAFALDGVLPGINTMSIDVHNHTSAGASGEQYTLPFPRPAITVAADSVSTMNLNLVSAKYVGIGLNVAWTPNQSIVTTGRDDNLIGFEVITLPAGSPLNGSRFFGRDDDQPRFKYSMPTDANTEGPCGKSWGGGFCAAMLPSPSVYDFYLTRSGDFFGDISTATVTEQPYPHFTVISSSKNVIIDNAHALNLVYPPWGANPSNGVLVNLTPATNMSSRGNATLYGQVTAANFFRQADFDALGGDFDKFVEYLPLISLYDANGAFSAAGIVLPPPSFIVLHMQHFDSAFADGYVPFKDLLDSAGAFGYEIRDLAPLSCYTAVVTTPNYPPYQRNVCLGDKGSTTTVSVNLDSAVGAGATLQGTVTSTSSVVGLANASVEISGEGIDARASVTNSSGAYKFEGLPAGTVKVKVLVSGYALGEAEKGLSGNNSYTQNFALKLAGGSISGTVYSQKLPFAKVQPGASIFAYDDTYNGLNPGASLSLLSAITGSDGMYTLTGLVPGDTYKVSLKVPGRYMLNQSVVASTGLVSGVDFTMQSKPFDLEVFARLGENSYEFKVINPADFRTARAWIGVSPFVSTTTALEIVLNKLSSGELSANCPLVILGAGTYVLHIEAVSELSRKTTVKEVTFGKAFKNKAEQKIDEAILGDDSDNGKGRKNNEIAIDESGGDLSALTIPAGAMLPVSSAAIPSCTFTSVDKSNASAADKVAVLGADAFAGSLYDIELSSVVLNPDKGFDVTLAYDKSSADLADLAVARYNDATGKWETVPGLATINPLKGTVKVKLKSLASVLSVKKGYGPAFSSFNGREYVVRPMAGGFTTSGTFAVIRPSFAGDAFAGTKLKVFNYPNPFSLKDKAVVNSHGATVPNTAGTTIHVEVPAANAGAGHIRIYTLAGELVRDLSADFTGGAYNYVNWDGKNKSGQEVANGVYYGFVELAGSKANKKDATFKMVVIK